MGEIVVISEKILCWKTGVKNSETENWCNKLESVKTLRWKIGEKNSGQKMKKIGLTDEKN